MVGARRLALIAVAVVAVGAGLAGAASGTTSTVVTFLVRGNPAARLSVKPSATVSLLARTTMRVGDRLVIVASRGSEARQRTVVSCRLSPCPGRWRETTGVTVRLQALLMRRSGGTVGIVGRSRVVSVTWKPPPPAPPKPAATPGHYEGRTSQNEILRFDVTPDGLGIVNLQTGEINQSCDPHNNLSGGNIGPLTSRNPLARDGSFTIVDSGTASITGPAIIDTAPGTYRYTLTGHVVGSVATGTLTRNSVFTYRGVTYTCSSGNVTWTATKT